MSHFEPGDQRVQVRPRDGEGRKRGFGGVGVMAAGIAVFAGIIWYAYSQGNKAGTESVAPVLHADQSPMKVRPEQPGGMEVPHQDKLVYDRLNPGKDGKDGDQSVERLLPPPEAPLARPKAAEAAPEPAGGDGDLPPEEAGAAPAAAPAPPGPAAAAPAPTPAPQPATPAQAKPAAPPAVAAAPAAPVAVAPPAAKPAAVPPPAAAKPPAQVAAAAPPAAPAAGSTRIQVASVGNEALANSEWQRIAKKHAAVLGGVGYRIVKADLGAKGTYYRVQAGPMDDAKAKQVCEALKAKGDGCIPVR